MNDLKHALRMFRRNPGFTIAAIAALALGIGANTAVFSVVNVVLLAPLHAPDPGRVVYLMNSTFGNVASEIEFNLLREQTDVMEEVSAYRLAPFTLTSLEQPMPIGGLLVTTDYFKLFGLPMARGRAFTAEDEAPGSAPVVVLNDALWKHVFGGDPEIIGKVIGMNGKSFQVIGITTADARADIAMPIEAVWTPFPIAANSSTQGHSFAAIARLKAGITVDAANARLQVMTQEYRRRYPNTISATRRDVFSVQPMRDVIVKDARPTLLALAGAVSLVLLIACANVANLLLVRAAGRRREIAIRMAMGAGRGRIVRQLLTESVSLAMAGAVLGAALGMIAIRGLLRLSTVRLPRIATNATNVTMDARVLLFTVLAALATGVVFGLIPALQASRGGESAELKEGGGWGGTGFRKNKTRSLLVIGEMSLALLLLIGSALLMRTLIALRSVNPGFDASHILTTRTPLDPLLFGKKAQGADQIREDVLRRLRALPGVERAAMTRMLPLDGNSNRLPVIVAGRPLSGPSHGFGRWIVVSSGYLDVMKIPVVRGRGFTDADRLDSPGVAVVSQTMARQLWPNGDPLQDRIVIGRGLGPAFDEPARQIVGVVGDVHDDALNQSSQPAVYVPAEQIPEARSASVSVAWIVRTRGGESQELRAAMQKEVQAGIGGIPIQPVRSMEDVLDRSTAQQGFQMLLMSIFGGVALVLATIGIHGSMAYIVQQRTREIGIRLALGADPRRVRNMVLSQGMGLAGIGVAIGVGGALGLTTLIRSLLFGVAPRDVGVFVAAPVFLSAVALLAVWIPARRATRIDPLDALRHE